MSTSRFAAMAFFVWTSIAACSPSTPPAPRSLSPATAGMPQTDGVVRQVQGRVVERLDAGYLYLHVEDGVGERHWVVSLPKDITVGADVDVSVFGTRRDFFSKRLERRFDALGFGVVRTR